MCLLSFGECPVEERVKLHLDTRQKSANSFSAGLSPRKYSIVCIAQSACVCTKTMECKHLTREQTDTSQTLRTLLLYQKGCSCAGPRSGTHNLSWVLKRHNISIKNCYVTSRLRFGVDLWFRGFGIVKFKIKNIDHLIWNKPQFSSSKEFKKSVFLKIEGPLMYSWAKYLTIP